MGMKAKSPHFCHDGQGGNVSRATKTTRETILNKRRPTFPKNDSQLKHMFRKGAGHLPDTPKNRNIIANVASNEDNYIGNDRNNNRWYARTDKNGQYWVKVRNGMVVDCGFNTTPRPINQIYDRKEKK